MESNFDKSLQEKLRAENELPSGLSWDAMGDNITSHLDKEKSKEKIAQLVKTNKLYKRILLGAAIILLSSLCIYVSNNALLSKSTSNTGTLNKAKGTFTESQRDQPSKNANAISNTNKNGAKVSDNTLNANQSNENSSQPALEAIENANRQKINLDNKLIESKAINKDNKSIQAKNTKEVASDDIKNSSPKSPQIKEITSTPSVESNNSSLKENYIPTEINVEKPYVQNDKTKVFVNTSSDINIATPNTINKNRTETETHVTLSLLPYSDQTIENKHSFPHLQPNLISTTPVEPKAPRPLWFIEVASGINTTYVNMENHQLGLGMSSVVLLSRHVGRINLSSGLEYNLIHDRFEKSAQTREFSVFKPNTLTKLQVDLVSKDTLKIYTDTMVNARESRHVIHNNYYQRLAVPLFASVDFKLKKINFNIGLGLSAYKFIQQSGKHWDGSQFVEISNTSPFLNNNWKLDYVTQMSMTYPISTSMDVGLRLGANLRSQNLSTLSDVKSSWTWQQIQVMARKRF